MNTKKKIPSWIFDSPLVPICIVASIYFAHGFLGAIDNPLTASEEKTIFFSRQYFSITFLLSTYNNEMPLYYLFSHFILFLPKGFFILRCLSMFFCLNAFICFWGGFNSFRKYSGADKEHYDLLATMLFVSVYLLYSQTFIYSFWKAIPFSFNAFLIACSLLFFIKAHIRDDSSKRPVFIIFAVLSFYSSIAGAIVFVLEIIYLALSRILPDEMSVKRENINNFKKDFFRIFLFIIPAAFIYILGFWKQSSESATFLSYCDTCLMKNLNSTINTQFELLVIPVFLIFCAVVWSIALCVKFKKNLGKALPFLLFFVFAALFGALSFVNDKDITDKKMNNIMSCFSGCPACGKDGFLFLTGCTKDDRYVYLNFLSENDINGLVFPGKNALGSGLNLGSRFPSFGNNNEKDVFIRQVKELFLQSDGVWVFYYCEGTDKCKPENHVHYLESKNAPESAVRSYDWIDKTTRINDSSGNNEGGYFAKYHRLKPGFSRDGILLDLFVNDYGDKDRAAELIQDETFKPEMLGSYFWNDEKGRVEAAASALANACGEDGACRKTALSKIDLFSKSVAKLSGPLRRF
ncbi:MAG: hypothetical protein NT078_00365, partial [Candidatus Azambacteria bacterium]|nr:hypothetical protein [Candidatus Azambacteria bacterium]